MTDSGAITTTQNTPSDTSGYTWGIFNDEGMLEGALSYPVAVAAANAADEDDSVIVDRECSEHEGERATVCEQCATDEEEDEQDDEDEAE